MMFLSVKVHFVTHLPLKSPKQRVNDSTDWELFKSSLQLEFDNFSFINDNVWNVDSTWEVWKGNVTEVANKTIGKTKRMKVQVKFSLFVDKYR
jgi:hypothetical protein